MSEELVVRPSAGAAFFAPLPALVPNRACTATGSARGADNTRLPGTDGVDVVRCAVAPLYYRLFVTGETVDDPLADRYADAAATAPLAGVFRPETP